MENLDGYLKVGNPIYYVTDGNDDGWSPYRVYRGEIVSVDEATAQGVMKPREKTTPVRFDIGHQIFYLPDEHLDPKEEFVIYRKMAGKRKQCRVSQSSLFHAFERQGNVPDVAADNWKNLNDSVTADTQQTHEGATLLRSFSRRGGRRRRTRKRRSIKK